MSTVLRMIYFGLALVGAIFAITNGEIFMDWERPSYYIAAVSLVIMILVETYVRKDYHWAAISLLGTFVFGVGCSLPLYLALRGWSFNRR